MTESLQNEVCIVIPIYKVEPSISETESLRQCFRVLGKHAICLVTPEDLNLYWYNDIIEGAFTNQNWKVEYFEKSYFISIKGYNSLMLSEKFYERFKEFKYILIYQF